MPVDETLAAMESFREDGFVGHLGVSNFTRDGLAEAIDVAAAPIVTDQIQYHPFVDQRDRHSFCVEADAALPAYSPLARGADVGHDELARIGQRYDESVAQVALRWLLQQRNVVAVPRSSSREHLAANRHVFDFELTDAEVERVHELTGGLRTRVANVLPPP